MAAFPVTKHIRRQYFTFRALRSPLALTTLSWKNGEAESSEKEPGAP